MHYRQFISHVVFCGGSHLLLINNYNIIVQLWPTVTTFTVGINTHNYAINRHPTQYYMHQFGQPSKEWALWVQPVIGCSPWLPRINDSIIHATNQHQPFYCHEIGLVVYRSREQKEKEKVMCVFVFVCVYAACMWCLFNIPVTILWDSTSEILCLVMLRILITIICWYILIIIRTLWSVILMADWYPFPSHTHTQTHTRTHTHM